MASFVILLTARTARIACSDRHTDTHTHTRDNYCNPLCACAPRVNYQHFNNQLKSQLKNKPYLVCTHYYIVVTLRYVPAPAAWRGAQRTHWETQYKISVPTARSRSTPCVRYTPEHTGNNVRECSILHYITFKHSYLNILVLKI